MITVFATSEFKKGNLSSVEFSWYQDDIEIEDSVFPNKKHTDLIERKPIGDYSEVKKYKISYDPVLQKLIKEEDTQNIKLYFEKMISSKIWSNVIYYQDMNSRPQDQYDLDLKSLFPKDLYIGNILNDAFYLKPDQFELKYARLAKKAENITKEFDNPSIKFTIKSGFLTGDQEVIIYQRNSSSGDIHVAHMAKDHIHMKQLIESIHGETPFWIAKNNPDEKVYQVFGTSLFPTRDKFPSNLNHANIRFTMAGNLAIIEFGYFFKNSPWLIE